MEMYMLNDTGLFPCNYVKHDRVKHNTRMRAVFVKDGKAGMLHQDEQAKIRVELNVEL